MQNSGPSGFAVRRSLGAVFVALFASTSAQTEDSCNFPPITWVYGTHKALYRVGVLAIRGFDDAFAEFNTTFSDYLTATAGQRFDRPVEFEMEPLDFELLFTETENGNVDFLYVNPSAFACIESEYGANTLATQISKRVVADVQYDLTEFGGVIFTKAGSSVNTIYDIRNKTVAAASISGLGSGQAQFRLMQQAGLSYINDPRQIIFTSDQTLVVNGVLYGEFEVGFVRTDQIEGTIDANTGELVDRSLLKIIEPKEGLVSDGEAFPFESSSTLYPEWNLAAQPFVPDDISTIVQESMYALVDHAEIGDLLETCYAERNCTGVNDYASPDECEAACNVEVTPNRTRCDTTPEIALLASSARSDGKYTGWRSTLSYMELRNMLEEIDFIRRDPTSGLMQCIRSDQIYESITCPVGHFKKTEAEVNSGCADAGLPCGEDYQCVCKPCVKAYDVDVFPTTATEHAGCAKMSLCGTLEQTKDLVFEAVDNKKREDLALKVRLQEGQGTRDVETEQVANHTFRFKVSANQVGVMIMEVFAGGEQIPESPLRIQVIPRDCKGDYADALRLPNVEGICVCTADAVEIGGKCVSYAVLLPSTLVPVFLIAIVATFLYVDRKRRQADSVWTVKASELRFNVPPVVVGRGTFGLVLLAEYRGTYVAVKRVIPPKVRMNKKGEARRTSEFGAGDKSSQGLTSMGSVVENAIVLDSAFSKDVPEFPAQRRRSSAGMISGSYGRPETVSGTRTRMYQSTDTHINKEHVQFSSGNHSGWRSGGSAGSTGSRSGWHGWKTRPLSMLSRMTSIDEYSRLKAEFIVEMRLLSKLRHPNITTVMGAVIAKGKEPMLVMEYMEHGSLYDLLHNDSIILDGELLLPVLRDIAQGVRFLHSANPKVIHGDLKAQNVLVDSKFRAKVADFGLSQKRKVLRTGTPYWMAPELLRGESSNTPASDVYSFGMILYEAYSREDPYNGETYSEVIRQIVDPTINKRPPVPEGMPPQVVSLMHECLSGDPEKRPTFEELDERLRRLDVGTAEPRKLLFSHQGKKHRMHESHNLMFDSFPPHVADALRNGRKVEMEHFDVVTIFFSDIVGFTDISGILTPAKVSDMLDRLYTAFDALSDFHEIFKIETIGDAYMCVTNLVKEQPDHTKRIAEFAIDAIKAANNTLVDEENPEMGTVNIRVGFHSGPVVANVVGTRNLKYSIFGDTVNTASRMESNSIKNRIQCSDVSAALLMKQGPNIPMVARGAIQVKGKGEMFTYWVNEESVNEEEPYQKPEVRVPKFETLPELADGDAPQAPQVDSPLPVGEKFRSADANVDEQTDPNHTSDLSTVV